MAHRMLIFANVCIQRLKPNPLFSHQFLLPPPTSPSLITTTLAIFNSKPKTPPNKASLLGEAITGKGILSQNLETEIPIYEAEPLLFFILLNLLGAIGALGDSGRFVDDTSTGPGKAVILPGKGFRAALGLGERGPLFGFTKANELFVGRLAQFGIAFSIIGEIIIGKGALAQLNIETGVPINEIKPFRLFNIGFFFATIDPGTGKFPTDEEQH